MEQDDMVAFRAVMTGTHKTTGKAITSKAAVLQKLQTANC